MKISRSLLLLPLLLFAVAVPASAINLGEAAPDFTLPDLAGNKITLSDFKGQIIILKLATTWCPTCKQQTGEIARIGDFLQENKVAVVEVFVQDSEKMVRDYFADEKELSGDHAVLLDDGTVAKSYNIYVIPRVLLIDQSFRVQRDGSLIGGFDLKTRIEQLTGR